MSWQDAIREDAPEYGLIVTSGYRTREHNAAIGGAPGSLHTHGTPELPGAIDVAGPAGSLRALFDNIKEAFKGRIVELYLNIPGGQSEAIRHNQAISSNPEAGRGQHLHIALETDSTLFDKVSTPGQVAMRLGTAVADAGGQLGEKGLAALGRAGLSPGAVGVDQSACSARLCLPTVPHLLDPPPCVCWSDVWAYGAGVAGVAFGLWMLLGNQVS